MSCGGRRHYIAPVCLYPHTKYRTENGVIQLFREFDFGHNDYLIVIADRLSALDSLVTGRYASKQAVFSKARKDAKQVFQLIKRVAREMRAQGQGKLVYWDDIGQTDAFTKFSTRIREGFLGEGLLADALEKFVVKRVVRFGLGGSPAREREHEREYLLSEVSMSVYCTEVLGYSHEIWERRPANDLPDPIKLLYDERPEVVVAAVGHPTRRSQHYLFGG